jgi:neutral ceramidase
LRPHKQQEANPLRGAEIHLFLDPKFYIIGVMTSILRDRRPSRPTVHEIPLQLSSSSNMPPIDHRQDGDDSPRRRRSLTALFAALFLMVLTIFGVFYSSTIGGARRSTILDDWEIEDDSRILLTKPRATPVGDNYLIGVGKADITGPVVEVEFAGYASLEQVGTGLRQRLYSRAFIVGDVDNPDDRFIYLVLDIQGGDTAVRYGILDGVKSLGSEYSIYGQSNVAVTGTHSHSGPGAWFNYLLSLSYRAKPCFFWNQPEFVLAWRYLFP